MSLKLVFNGERKQAIVSFANGVPLKESCFPATILTHATNSDNRMMVVNGSLVKYVGNKNDHEHGCKFLAAKINSTTGLAEVFSTESYVLRPVVPTNLHCTKEDIGTNPSVKRNFWQQQDDLNTDFGSHRKRKALNSRLRNNITDSTDALNDSISKTIETDESLCQGEISLSLNQYSTVLPCNIHADVVEDVYAISSLFSNELLHSIVQEATALVNSSEEQVQKWIHDKKVGYSCKFVLEHLDTYKDHTTFTVERQAVYLQLFIYLVVTYKLRHKDYCSKDIEAYKNFNGTVKMWLLSTFFLGQGKGRKMPYRLKHKILAYAIIIAWHLDNFNTNCTTLIDAFDNISPKMLSTHVKSLGGSVQSVKDYKGKKGLQYAKLNLPLNFPKVPHKKR